MFAPPYLLLSAWVGHELVGLCRLLTDYSYRCYRLASS